MNWRTMFQEAVDLIRELIDEMRALRKALENDRR